MYNNVETIGDAIESVLAQDYPDVERIVIDGGSTDGTLELIQKYSDRLSIVVSEPDGGIYDALNKGIRLATGDVVGFLHSDDVFADKSVLSRIAAGFREPGVDAVYGDLVYVKKSAPDQIVRYWKAGEFRSGRLRWGWMPPHPTFYVKRAIYTKMGAFDTNFRIAADYECMLRLLGRAKIRSSYVPSILVKMRLGGASNRSLKNLIRKSVEDYKALRLHDIGGMGALAWKNLSKLRQFPMRNHAESATPVTE